MALIGKVTAVNSEWIQVALETPTTSCAGCGACGGMISEGQRQRSRLVQARPGDIVVAEGDMVELDASPGTGSLAAFLLFGTPLVAFFVGLFFLPGQIVVYGWPQGEGWALLAAFLSMGVCLGLLGILVRLGCFRALALHVIARHPPDWHPSAPNSCPSLK